MYWRATNKGNRHVNGALELDISLRMRLIYYAPFSERRIAVDTIYEIIELKAAGRSPMAVNAHEHGSREIILSSIHFIMSYLFNIGLSIIFT